MVGNKGNKKQSTVASSSPTADEPAVAESEGDASYPVQERQQDQEYRSQCVYATYNPPCTEEHSQNLAVKTEQTEDGTSDYHTGTQQSPTAEDTQQQAEPTPPDNAHSATPETSSAVLQNAQPVFPRPQSRSQVYHHVAEQETPPPSLTTNLAKPAVNLQGYIYAKLVLAFQFFVSLAGPETIPNILPVARLTEYFTSEAVITDVIPREAGWFPYVPPPPIIRGFDVGLSGPDPGGGLDPAAANTDESYYDSEMAKYCTKEAIVDKVVPQ
jgi:hypothetical protein